MEARQGYSARSQKYYVLVGDRPSQSYPAGVATPTLAKPVSMLNIGQGASYV